MHHKFTKHGKGSARGGAGAAAINYLLGELDHKGEPRPDIQVLRGDPYAVAAVVDTLNFARTYTSGVISWSPEEAPTDAEIAAVLADWEALAFAGLEPDRYAFTAVLHREIGGGVHIHTIAARVDLETGNSLNIAPPGHRKDFDAFRDKWNHKMGWARPDDPLRKRDVQPDFEAYRTHPNTSKLRTELTDFFTSAAAKGLVSNAAELRQYAAEVLGCEITRSGDDYISLKPAGFERAIRLKGGMYGDGWTVETALEREAKASASRGIGRGGAIDKDRAREAQRVFDESCERRAGYNQKRYFTAEQRDQLTLEQPDPSDREPDPSSRQHEEPDTERNERDQKGVDGRIAQDAEPSLERLAGAANGSGGQLESEPEQDIAGSAQDAAQFDKRLDSALESEHVPSSEGGRSPEQNSIKSVVETITGLSRSDSGGGRSPVFDNWSAVSVPHLPIGQVGSTERGNQGGTPNLESVASGCEVRIGEREEIHLFQEDQRSRGLRRGTIRGGRVNDGTDRDRAPVSAAATRSAAEPARHARATQERDRGLTAAAKRLAERMGEYTEQLRSWVQSTAERFRSTQEADAERLTDVQRADRARLTELTSPEPAARSADGASFGTGGAELEQISAASHELDRVGQVLDESLRGLETAVTAHLEQKAEQEQGHALRM